MDFLLYTTTTTVPLKPSKYSAIPAYAKRPWFVGNVLNVFDLVTASGRVKCRWKAAKGGSHKYVIALISIFA